MSSRPIPRRVGRRRPATFAVALVAVLSLALAACAGSRPSLGATAPTSTSTNTSTSAGAGAGAGAGTSRSTTGGARQLGPRDLLGFIATPLGTPSVYADADTASARITVPAVTNAKAPMTFAIVGDAADPGASAHPGWYRVLLPTRPNGRTAWVPEASVTVTKTPLRLFVDLTGRLLRVESDGAETMSVPIAVGTSKNPTPTGASYVTELIENTDPSGSYGPFAYGLALHSETLSEFAGGDGQVGIHGTNQPRLIGRAVSHGCVRLSNADVQKLVDLQLPLGVPVFIT